MPSESPRDSDGMDWNIGTGAIRARASAELPLRAQMQQERKRSVSDELVARLRAWGIKRIFGYPGDGINGIMGALRRAGDAIDFVQVAHEELASMAACAHAK